MKIFRKKKGKKTKTRNVPCRQNDNVMSYDNFLEITLLIRILFSSLPAKFLNTSEKILYSSIG